MEILTFVILSFGLGALFGAPWVPAFRRDFDELFRLAKVGPETNFVDLGCGDGKVMLAAARAGATVTGYEINPLLWVIAWVRLLPYGRRAHVRLGSFWGRQLSQYDVIWLYLIDHHMPRMARTLERKARPDAIVISYMFSFPKIKPIHQTYNSQIYTGKSFTSRQKSDKIEVSKSRKHT